MKSVYKGSEKVAEFDDYSELRVGGSKPAFIYEGSELVYPNPVKDGLVLWYDFSGRTNADSERGVAEDLSGNGNHGTLQNFNFIPESGYDKNKLLFDGVDDYINLPDSHMVFGDNKIGFSGGITFQTSHTLNGNFYPIGGSYGRPLNLEYRNLQGNIRMRLQDGEGRQFSIQLGELEEKTLYYLAFSLSMAENSLYYLLTGGGIVVTDRVDLGVFSGIPNHPLYIGRDFAYTPETILTSFSTKLYNRPLTPEEIAYNYAIEKERFGIE